MHRLATAAARPADQEVDIFLRDRATHKTFRISVANNGAQANGPSHSARGISPNGRYVTFESFATNLVSGNYDLSFRPLAGFGPLPPMTVAVTNGGETAFTNRYFATARPPTGARR